MTGKRLPLSQLMPANAVREPLVKLILRDHPTWNPNGYISMQELNKYRTAFVEDVLEEEFGKLTQLEKEVVTSISQNELLSKNLETEYTGQLSLGERLADKIASFGGSWRFILLFLGFLALWMTVNVIAFFGRPFDPFPFILLNLILSSIAALQAPVIMMSQNRQEEKDRLRAEHDYQINLKAELEIRQLHEKIDHLLMQQGHRLFQIQQIQMELLNEINERLQKE
ncbi:membrane protein [Rufibacter radiotolerans]|uniref:Membrane protein n=1 Tax=Rufibacter radiotolerans TaxID=1379910 RepID=A0A0H4VPD7_9BACT|nr:membrane protein [Rufibacter radiotolerans]